jgi:hypothetical protein
VFKGAQTIVGISADSVRGSPDVDSLSGSILIDTLVGQQNNGIILNDSVKVVSVLDVDSVASNTVFTGSITIDGSLTSGNIDSDTIKGPIEIDTLTCAGPKIEEIDTISNDTIRVIIGGVTFKLENVD